jgi:hypothetical protein
MNLSLQKAARRLTFFQNNNPPTRSKNVQLRQSDKQSSIKWGFLKTKSRNYPNQNLPSLSSTFKKI